MLMRTKGFGHIYTSPCAAHSVMPSGAEGETGEAAGCSGRPTPSQRGETEGTPETQGGGERKEEEGGRRGHKVNLGVCLHCIWLRLIWLY